MSKMEVYGFNKCPGCDENSLMAFCIDRRVDTLELSMVCPNCGTHVWDDYELVDGSFCEDNDCGDD